MDVLAWGVSKWEVDDKLKPRTGLRPRFSAARHSLFFAGVIIDGLWVSPRSGAGASWRTRREARPLRDRPRARQGRDGCRLSCEGPLDWSSRRAEDHSPRARRGRRGHGIPAAIHSG